MADQKTGVNITERVGRINEPVEKPKLRFIPEWAGKIIQILLSILFAVFGLSAYFTLRLIDFLAFIGAGLKFRSFESPYGPYLTSYGASVFQSVPWLAWLFAPLSLFPVNLAFHIFVIINVGLLMLVFVLIGNAEKIRLSPLNLIYIFACALTISQCSLSFGQVTIIQLAILSVMIIAMQRGYDTLAGALLPLILFKPHLILWFLFCMLTVGRRRFIISGIFSTILVSAVAFAIQPSWPVEMITTFVVGQAASTMENWKFSTFTGILSLPPLYGLLVLPLSFPGLMMLRSRIKRLPLSSQLAIGLAFSLATSPYAFAYDLPLLIPALIWLSRRWSLFTAFIWFSIAAIALLSGFSGASYLATLATCVLILVKIFVVLDKKQPGPLLENENKYLSSH